MGKERIRILGILAIAGLVPAFAEDAGKAAAKAYAQDAAKPAVKAAAKAQRPQAPAAPGRMQVEEPVADASNADAKASRAWQKTHAKGLTDGQKEAFRERKEKMEDMIALIKAKRQALRDAKPEERAAIARELHSLILDKEGDASGTAAAAARVEAAPEPAAEKAGPREKGPAAREKGENQNPRREEYRQRQQERYKARKNRDD